MVQGAQTVAVIDIGTNSTRLLVAEVVGDEVRELARRSTVTRLGGGVDLSGSLSNEAIERVCAAIEGYIAVIDEIGVDRIKAIATSAVRDAANGTAFIAELRERFFLEAEVIDGNAEAQLTYTGTTAANPPTARTLVVDIGGGSTELIIGRGRKASFFTSLQAGVVRQTERHLVSDPPNTPQLEALATDIRQIVDVALEEVSDAEIRVEQAIGVAGTPTSLAAIDLGLETYDSEKVHGHVLALPNIQRMLSQLAGLPLPERAKITGLHPDRAPTIVAGVVILIEIMRAFSLDEIAVSEHDILYGAAIAAP
jgi:exopolyphosphatase/guanosine-5'-triphosphate,3'-diphosphate pyrophosphatase